MTQTRLVRSPGPPRGQSLASQDLSSPPSAPLSPLQEPAPTLVSCLPRYYVESSSASPPRTSRIGRAHTARRRARLQRRTPTRTAATGSVRAVSGPVQKPRITVALAVLAAAAHQRRHQTTA